MKYTETSYQTKKKLANALEQMLAIKPFNKVTVGDLIEICGLNRKTFYYHFTDIHALLTWKFSEDFAGMFTLYESNNGYAVLANTVLDYATVNESILSNVLNTDGEGDFIRALKECIGNLNRAVVSGFEMRKGARFEEDFRTMLIEFMTGAVLRVFKDWIERRDYTHRDITIEYMSHLFRTTLEGLLENGKYLEK